MINYYITHLLYIEPENDPTKEPVNDEIVDMYDYIIEQWDATDSDKRYRGVHVCKCGTKSDNVDHMLKNNMHYNSLGLHYLQYHRKEVPRIEIEKIKTLYTVVRYNNTAHSFFKLPETPLYKK